MDKDKNEFLEDDFDLDIEKNSTKKTTKKPTTSNKAKKNNVEFNFDEYFAKVKDFFSNISTTISENTSKDFLKILGLFILIFLLICFIASKLLSKPEKDTGEVTINEINIEVLEPVETTIPVETTVPEEIKTDVTTTVPEKNTEQFTNLRLKYENNQDIVGYILIFDTKINMPVAQTTDNTFYQDHDLSKNKNIDGALYFDATSPIDIFSKNTIIYGRCDIPYEQLCDLALYNDESFYKENRFINLDTLYSNSVWEIFSFYPVEDDYSYLKTNFQTEKEFETFIMALKNKSIYAIDTEVSKDDKILTLTSTNTTGEKYVLHAKLYRQN